MTGLWIAAGIVLFFVFLLTVPIHLLISADEHVRVWARVLFIKIGLFPEQ